MRAVEQLCSLLREDPEIRARWVPYAPEGGHGIHQGALARVLAEYQWRIGEEPPSNTDLPRRLKDTVSRALSGKTLSRRALTLFISAFEIDDATAKELWVTWEGSDQVFEPYADLSLDVDPPHTYSRRVLVASASG
ncbi:MAG: hypothetical protein WA880_12700 [Ornithinimicrobium sp.]